MAQEEPEGRAQGVKLGWGLLPSHVKGLGQSTTEPAGGGQASS